MINCRLQFFFFFFFDSLDPEFSVYLCSMLLLGGVKSVVLVLYTDTYCKLSVNFGRKNRHLEQLYNSSYSWGVKLSLSNSHPSLACKICDFVDIDQPLNFKGIISVFF